VTSSCSIAARRSSSFFAKPRAAPPSSGAAKIDSITASSRMRAIPDGGSVTVRADAATSSQPRPFDRRMLWLRLFS